MIANYIVHFREPWQDAPMTGYFNRWVYNEDEAVRNQVYYEMKYKELYKDEFATVELVSVS